jgi:hypothetical protein
MNRAFRWTVRQLPLGKRPLVPYDETLAWGPCLMVYSTRTPADRPSGANGRGKKQKQQATPQHRWFNAWLKKNADVTDSKTDRGLLWLDAVGGFLVLLGDEVTIGQAVPGNDIEIPVVGDLSRHHARLRRLEDTYLIDPLAPTRVEGMVIDETIPLSDGDEITLGDSVHIRFRQPTSLSDSARLEMISHHRTQPSSDGILLFGQTCLLGPTDQNHVCCPDWEEQIVLSRNNEESFRFRANQRVEIDGITAADTGILLWNANLAGSRFALRFERL